MAALTFTTAGIAYETWYGLKNRYKTPGFTLVVFYGNVVVKALLIGGIALKTVCGDDPRGIAFLAMVVVLAFVWNLLALAVKKKKRKGNSELLDDVG